MAETSNASCYTVKQETADVSEYLHAPSEYTEQHKYYNTYKNNQ